MDAACGCLANGAGSIQHIIRLAFVVPSYLYGTTNANLIILWVMDSTRHDKLGGYAQTKP
jgi:hypothetical protein